MHEAWLPRQVDLDDTVPKCASAPCGMNGADPAYFGYWSKEGILEFLGNLLESERVGTEMFAAIGRAADLPVSDLVFESELAQGAICVLLKKEIVARGGAVASRRKNTIAISSSKCSLQRAITFARYHQTRLSDVIEDAVLNIFDTTLNTRLMYLVLLHRKQVELLETLLL